MLLQKHSSSFSARNLSQHDDASCALVSPPRAANAASAVPQPSCTSPTRSDIAHGGGGGGGGDGGDGGDGDDATGAGAVGVPFLVPELLEELASVYDELGDARRAEECRRDLRALEREQ